MRNVERYRRMVDHFEQVARANIETLTRVSDLCRAAGVNGRTLARAFQAVHGTTPAHFLRTLRLTEARRALLSACDDAKSVTEIATRFGFRELGRFAGMYRARFGESPSETLRRSYRGADQGRQGAK